MRGALTVCRDCRHCEPWISPYVPSWFDRLLGMNDPEPRWDTARCKRSAPIKFINSVTGEVTEFKAGEQWCYTERRRPHFDGDDRCGPDGKYWEPRP